MASKLIDFGLTLCAYASARVEIPDGATPEVAIDAIRRQFETTDMTFMTFSPCWDSSYDHRIVGCRDDSRLSAAIQDTPIDPPLFVDRGCGDLDDVIELVSTAADYCEHQVRAKLMAARAKLDRLKQAHGNLKPDADAGACPSSVEVRHWNCYGIGGTCNTHVSNLDDQRWDSGQVFLDLGALGSHADDRLYLTAEIDTSPVNPIEAAPCVHVNFDQSELAMSIYRVDHALVVCVEEGATFAKLEGGRLSIRWQPPERRQLEW